MNRLLHLIEPALRPLLARFKGWILDRAVAAYVRKQGTFLPLTCRRLKRSVRLVMGEVSLPCGVADVAFSILLAYKHKEVAARTALLRNYNGGDDLNRIITMICSANVWPVCRAA